LLQGTLDLLILRTLLAGPSHGHAIAKHIQRTSEELLQVETGSLYPALHRLEAKGLIAPYQEPDRGGLRRRRSAVCGATRIRESRTGGREHAWVVWLGASRTECSRCGVRATADPAKPGIFGHRNCDAGAGNWRRHRDVSAVDAASLTGGDIPEQVPAGKATGNLWSVLGVKAQIGRTFTEEEDTNGVQPAVISYGLWIRW